LVDLGEQLLRDLVEHGLEQRLLGREVMIDRAFGDARGRGDIVDRGRGETLLTEQTSGRLGDRSA
jgi:hypothetical protein